LFRGFHRRLVKFDYWLAGRKITIEMLPELYATNYQTAFLCSCRVDIGVARTNSFWMLKGILAE
jgi:HK97 family phage major capsid protein